MRLLTGLWIDSLFNLYGKWTLNIQHTPNYTINEGRVLTLPFLTLPNISRAGIAITITQQKANNHFMRSPAYCVQLRGGYIV
jgi:hypothetical protein